MTNILIVGSSHIASFDLAVEGFERLSQIISFNIRPKLLRNVTSGDISWCDILLCVRGNHYLHTVIARKAVKAGRMVVLSLDDDLLEFTPDAHPYLAKLCKSSLKKIISLSSYLLTTSKYLGEKYQHLYNINYILSDTIVESSDIKSIVNTDGVVKILYAANPGHKFFFDSLITPILNDVFKKYKDRVSLTIIGPDIDDSTLDMHVVKIPSMEIAQYQSYMMGHHFDIGLAPLFDNEVCRSKYYNKFIEYSKYSICGIYSNLMPYNLIVRNRENGILVSDSPEDWFKAICFLVENPTIRIRCYKNAQLQLKTQFCVKSIANRLISSFPEIETFKAPTYNFSFGFFMYTRFVIYEIFSRLLNKFK